jgi:hypothetical protein
MFAMVGDADHPFGATAAMAIGDLVLYQGRRYVLLGIDPMSVSERRAELEDLESGERVLVPFDDVAPLDGSARV